MEAKLKEIKMHEETQEARVKRPTKHEAKDLIARLQRNIPARIG